MNKKRSKLKIGIIIAVVLTLLLAGVFAFYRIYLYNPVLIAMGGKLESWDISFQSGMLVVNTNYSLPDDADNEAIQKAMEKEYNMSDSKATN